MSKHKNTDIICAAITFITLVITVMFIFGENFGVIAAHAEPEYASKLFSTDKIHTIDIQVKQSDWDDMLENAQDEKYIPVTVVIDGETIGGVGLRPKGNSSLSMIARSDSDRYSFKVEFDHYSSKIKYHGLDKIALNNIAQDNTYMKDYVSYQMMNAIGANAPLSSFIWTTVNGADWGLYLAVEGVEESFARRVYDNDSVEIYKPESTNMGEMPQIPDGGFGNGKHFPGEDQMPNFDDFSKHDRFGEMPDGATSLTYTDDSPDSYSAIFDNAVFKTSDGDKSRLIASLKQLNADENIDRIVDVDEVIRYFAVHNFVLNSDSYTGNIVHNYYLAENEGRLSMIAWDYNLAFGGMGGFGRAGGKVPDGQTKSETSSADTATRYVNYPMDSPMLSGSIEDRPMIAWIFNDEKYLAEYHGIYAEYMKYFSNGKFAEMYDKAVTLISPYVRKDPTAFCTYEEFQKGAAALRKFCLLRAESIINQLNGSIASTNEEQVATGNANFVAASDIDMSSMGSNSMKFERAHIDAGAIK